MYRSAAESAYRADVERVCATVLADRNALVEQIRLGDQSAREQLILSLCPIILAYACRLQNYYVAVMDLVGVGNLAVVTQLDEALTKDCPPAYLLAFAKGEMIHYYRTRQNAITIPSSADEPYTLFSVLDEVNTDEFDIEMVPSAEQVDEDMTPLYQALQALPTVEARTIMTRLAGLFGHDAQSLIEMAGGDSTTKTYQSLKTRRLDYLKKMRVFLTEHYPDFTQRHSREKAVKPLSRASLVTIPPTTMSKLECAVRDLQDRGERLSMNKLRKESGVNTVYATAYLQRFANQEVQP